MARRAGILAPLGPQCGKSPAVGLAGAGLSFCAGRYESSHDEETARLQREAP